MGLNVFIAINFCLKKLQNTPNTKYKQNLGMRNISLYINFNTNKAINTNCFNQICTILKLWYMKHFADKQEQ